MKDLRRRFRKLIVLACGVLAVLCGSASSSAEAPAGADQAFDRYVSGVEQRLDRQHHTKTGFLVPAEAGLRVAAGQVAIERVTVPATVVPPGTMIHHWRATAFAPGATAREFEALLRDLPAYPRRFAPEVVRAALVSQSANTLETSMRVREQHVVAVWMDVSYEVRFGGLDAAHRFSVSRSTQVRELSGVGTAQERALTPDEEHGWLWRMNTYWSYEEADGGLYLQVESVSLTRAIPRGLGWAVAPYVESIPRESLEFTLRAVCRAIGK